AGDEPRTADPGAGTASESAAPNSSPARDGAAGSTDTDGESPDGPPEKPTAEVADPPGAPDAMPGSGDPTAEAYQRVRPGDCLSNHKTGEEWNSHLPTTVACASDAAFLRVTGVTDRADACPSGSGRGDWHHTSPEGGVTVLCLQREFRPGQCFPARSTDGAAGPGRAIPEADLHVWLDCGSERLPDPYNTVLVISDVLPAPDRVPAAVCSRGPGDRGHYWYWVLNGDTELVCATRPAR
ncbi:LppU/SCO3897 family protein, partial [Streptomyces alkaliphilus]|uniref:LppU/SCO3897 family protein n=1 Tax=Streptomyces alkaliphilus TaxID=1472722 RepID=UPI001566A22E